MYLPSSGGELFSSNYYVTKYPDTISLNFPFILLINCHIILVWFLAHFIWLLLCLFSAAEITRL
jgi:hypothetical protein